MFPKIPADFIAFTSIPFAPVPKFVILDFLPIIPTELSPATLIKPVAVLVTSDWALFWLETLSA